MLHIFPRLTDRKIHHGTDGYQNHKGNHFYRINQRGRPETFITEFSVHGAPLPEQTSAKTKGEPERQQSGQRPD
ncbi:hypothetical protein MJM83_28590, partial [Salmonella enterica subsp. enterica serovar Montevideo]|nr:hypothetical protein [Salmonella enterica subsp. enterica serovar Montevideo]MDI8751874.1 hypothetical protein [Salmonella enterica subsp. enterica serovar Montevideo]MDI9068826.1 hypothetical protein [Salmonella enterica subsp. enterica serovar Montevideo]